jgi:hypothetical protein
MKQADDRVCLSFLRSPARGRASLRSPARGRASTARPPEGALLATRRSWGTRALALALLAAAGSSEKTVDKPRQQGLAPGEERPLGPVAVTPEPPPPPAPPRAPSSLGSPFASPKPDPGSLQRTDPPPTQDPGAALPTTAEPHDKVAQRDLPAELTALLGQPASCLELASVAAAGGRLTIVVTAYAVPSGRITRASVDAPGQPASALRCLEQRATSASLRSPVPGAPLQVTATIPIEVISQPEPR